MIKKIIHFSVYHPFTVLFLTILVVLGGWFSFQHLSIDAVPDVTNVQVQINTSIIGMTPEEIERTVTFPLENAMSGIKGTTQVRSITRYGLSQITISFEDKFDIYRARQLVSERLQLVDEKLPSHIQPKVGPISTGLGEIFQYAVESEKIETGEKRVEQLMELRSLQDWYIKPRLLTVKGVTEVSTIGGFEKQFHIRPRIDPMTRYGIHFDDIEKALEKTNRNVGGGYIQQTGEQFLVQGTGLLKSIEEIKNVPIKSLQSFKTITLGEIAHVGLGTELRTGAGLVDADESVIGTTLMLIGENSRTVSKQVALRLKEIQKELPPGIKIVPLYNRSNLVDSTLDTVKHNLLLGALLVALVLFFLIGNARAALITAITIPISLLITFLIMRPLGISGNLMSLGALDFGIIVDGVIIVLDNCIRLIHHRKMKWQRNLTRSEIKEAVFDGAVQVRSAAGFGELIIVVVFIPIFALSGIEGKMFEPMAATFMIAVIAGLTLSFTTAPALASLIFSSKGAEKEPRLMLQLKRLYSSLLEFFLRLKKITVVFAIVSILVGIFLFSRLGGEFLPQLDEGSIVIQFIRPTNISVDQSIALQKLSAKSIRKFPEVVAVFSRLGTADVATDPMGVNLADTFITLKEKKEWPQIDGKRRTKAKLIADLVKQLEEEIPGQRILVTQPIQMRFNELLEGTRADISLKLFGEEMKTLVELTRKMADIVKKVPGAGDVEMELKGTSPLLRIKPDDRLLKELGISNQEILETVETALGGKEVGSLYEGMKHFPILIRLSETERSDLEAIKNLPVGIFSNMTVPLVRVAKIEFEEDYLNIHREGSKRRTAILINPRDRDTESFVKEAKEKVSREMQLPPGYYSEWGGNFKNLEEAKKSLSFLIPLALLLVLMMVYIAFRNVIQTLLIFLGVPLAWVGGVLALLLYNLPFSISAGVGFIALSGIAVLNGVVLVNFFNDLKKQGMEGEAVVLQGSLTRLRPVLMTALVDVFGFLPMMLSTGVGSEVQRPLATVVIGGILSSTFLTLIVLPIIYSWLDRKSSATSVHSSV